ncbi:Uncharacterized protein HZ326_18831 [Fusarium oxysporum f. sp. albedinis]|nr:Uncharacterized protein HZ326_19064 [Fusarium oxysporum f. sp. albedinis]KAJ0138201.1 Uncharacterized protein HZ326_18831 [Fusarium oxysporum f. sp. albedinis]
MLIVWLSICRWHVVQQSFPLSKLHDEFCKVCSEAHLGHGLKVVRGGLMDQYIRKRTSPLLGWLPIVLMREATSALDSTVCNRTNVSYR